MADETPKNVGDINFENNSANSGLNMDSTPSQIAKGSLTYALNAALENYDSNSINYQNEPGNEFCLNFPKGYVVIGKYFIPEQNRHIFFLSNPSKGASEIGQMLNNDCLYRTIINAPCLNFDQNFPIHKIVHKINNCNTEIYWAQPNDDRKYLNLDEIPYLPTFGSTPCDETLSPFLDCNQLRVQPNYSIPQLTVADVIIGGNLIAGAYQFAVQYSDALGHGLSSFHSITNPTPIADPQFATVNFNYPVGKAIVVHVDNLELGGQFEFFNLAVIKTINGITSVELVGTYEIDNESQVVTYSGQNSTLIQLTVNDVFEKFPFYGAADDVTAVEDVLVWKGLSAPERVNYQHIANQIQLLWETYRIPPTKNYSDELVATNFRGYLRDEIYPFEFVPLLRSGHQVDGFHIPGRRMTEEEILAPMIDPSNDDYIDPSGVPVEYWKIYNTAKVIGTSGDYTTDEGYEGPYQYGAMAYWESLDKYPCDTTMWGELADKPIRHHKFPDVLVSPIFDSPDYVKGDELIMGNRGIFPIGVRVDAQKIRELIDSSLLTAQQKADIVGFKIVRGDRTDNKSIVAKGILRNVGKYTRENQDFYFPNYPYNDLNTDPFINANNNAYSLQCETYNINVIKFTTPGTTVLTKLTVQYTDCNTNKTTTKDYTEVGQTTLCSLSAPILISTGVANKVKQTATGEGPIDNGTSNILISNANYDTYYVTNAYNGNPVAITWIDIYRGESTGNFYNTNLTVYVKKDSRPFCSSDGCGNNGEAALITLLEQVRTTLCQSQTPLEPIRDQEELAYRQIFNSPVTSFGQPFLGDVLKLESVIFGAGLSHFVEVKDNAKYRLLSEEAQRDAAQSADDIANGDVSAFFAAYQAYLTIYINGITRKNYAYSYNSIADYNYSRSIPNNQGVKQRRLDLKKYLIPAVQNVGDILDINNFERETSVFLRTEGSDDSDPTALPFPHEHPVMSGSGLIDYSRHTIGCTEADFACDFATTHPREFIECVRIGECHPHCTDPAFKEGITVMSYYASLKNTFRNQWGQIYAYQTIDTGFQVLFDSNVPQPTIVFGGDTFISRFAFKTKLPFFIDNRVGAPDDSDIFYDELGNIGYPKFWHSARSILKDLSFVTGTLTNFISFKAHNFDCPNSQIPPPSPRKPSDPSPSTNPNRTFYDGYFYLFAYGIPNFYCETSYNLDLRQAFNNKEGDFWPHVSNSIPDDWVQESFVSILNDNTYYYNTSFSKQNKENFFSHIPADWEFVKCNYIFPFRAIYSDPQNSTANTTVNNWLTYRASSYFDFPQNHGKLTSIDGGTNRQLLARFENKTLIYNALYTNQTSTGGQVYLGQILFSNQPPPFDFAETDLGYMGTQHKFLLKTPQGIITLDAKRGQVFIVDGTKLKDLVAPGSGMNRFFTDHLAFEILRYFPDVNIDNNFKDIGINGVYDSKFDRVIITKHDYIPLSRNIIYDSVTKEFYIEEKLPTRNHVTTNKLGTLYNAYVVSDVRNIANTGWHVANGFTDTQQLVGFLDPMALYNNNKAANLMKEVGTTYWYDTTSAVTNSSGFNMRGAGFIDVTLGYLSYLDIGIFWSPSTANTASTMTASYATYTDSTLFTSFNPGGTVSRDKKTGASIRLVKDSTTLINGQVGTYTGNDGTKYRTICINNREWLADNLIETKYRNGDIIPVVTDNTAWSNLTTGAARYPFDDKDSSYTIEEVNGEIITRKKISVTDKAYFCNVSWTLSYSMIAGSWISFHSYLPNYYIGESNFFYSGIKTCCVDFDVIAGVIVPNPTTTTTSSTSTTSSTTTTTTTFNCTIVGNVVVLNCNLVGTAVITVPPAPPACTRPVNVQPFSLYTGYQIITPPSTVVSTATSVVACNAKNFRAANFNNTVAIELVVWGIDLNIGTKMYSDNGKNDCTPVPDGFYYTFNPADPIYQISGGIISALLPCTPTLTSTTTTCNMYLYAFDIYDCGTCTVRGNGIMGNSQALTVGKFYYDPITKFKILITAFNGCSGGVDRSILDSTKKDNCPSAVCPP